MLLRSNHKRKLTTVSKRVHETTKKNKRQYAKDVPLDVLFNLQDNQTAISVQLNADHRRFRFLWCWFMWKSVGRMRDLTETMLITHGMNKWIPTQNEIQRHNLNLKRSSGTVLLNFCKSHAQHRLTGRSALS